MDNLGFHLSDTTFMYEAIEALSDLITFATANDSNLVSSSVPIASELINDLSKLAYFAYNTQLDRHTNFYELLEAYTKATDMNTLPPGIVPTPSETTTTNGHGKNQTLTSHEH